MHPRRCPNAVDPRRGSASGVERPSRAIESRHRRTRCEHDRLPHPGRSRSEGGPDAARRGAAVVRGDAGNAHGAHVLTLTDATVAVAHYLKVVRKRRLGFEELFPPPSLEDDFVRAAPVFGKAHGIEFDTWRQFGVDDRVLRRAGIGRRRPGA